jgi:hypothetical protein
MHILLKSLLITSAVLGQMTSIAYATGVDERNAQLNQKLDSIDAEIDRENNANVIDNYRADDLREQVDHIRNQEGMYDTGTLDEQADAVQDELSPLP